MAWVPLASLAAGDWPTYRHDLARSGVTSEALPLPLYLQWRHVPRHAPQPAWPEPGRELNRLDFDHAHGVTAAGGLVLFGSSADHAVVALEARTGGERWRFFTEGPVRFSPTIDGNRVFVASDDGWLYCLSLPDGQLLWRTLGGPREEKLLGNEQMISRWPLRSGVGVSEGVVYFAAGMWPAEGVCLCALSARDGRVIWRNETSAERYMPQPHPGSFSMTGVSPQGHVLAAGDQLFVPTGRNVPAAYHRTTGELLYYRGTPTTWNDRWGGCWNFHARGLLFGWGAHHGPDIDVQPGEYPADPKDGMMVFDAASGKEQRFLAGKLRAVVRGDTLFAAGGGALAAYDLNAWLAGTNTDSCRHWNTPLGHPYALILAGDTLFAGGKTSLTAVDARNGAVLWKETVSGRVRDLAVAGQRLMVSTDDGHIRCYSPDPREAPATVAPPPATLPEPAPPSAAALARQLIAASGKTSGFGLVLDAVSPELPLELARQSDLRLVCVEPDAPRVAALRNRLDAAQLYGVRVVVHQGTLDQVTYPAYFADLIVAPAESLARLRTGSADALYRLLHPYGGVARLIPADPRAESDAVRRWLAEGGVPEGEVAVSDGGITVRRGPLSGAGSWTHQYGDSARTGCSKDDRVRLPVQLLWFGQPGPAPLISRHWKGPAPLVVRGRLFVIGQKCLIAVDAYNGRELWRRDFPKVGRWPVDAKGSSVAADETSLYLVQERVCLRLDAATGNTIQAYRLPTVAGATAIAPAWSLWSHLAVSGDLLLGSIGNELEATHVFALGKADGQPRWIHAARNTVNNNGLAVTPRRVFLLDRRTATAVTDARRRGMRLDADATLLALDAATGAVLWQTPQGVGTRIAVAAGKDVVLATSGSGLSGYAADTGRLLYDREAVLQKSPLIVDETVYAYPGAYDLRTGLPRQRALPFTGEREPWSMSKSYGCGHLGAGNHLLLFRSATLGFYDLVDDSGIHNFGGVRAGCYVNAIAADGLVLSPPADAGCTCSYSYQTTVALVPADRPRHWSLFYDRLPKTEVRHAALNLGAPGDRRDPKGALWLALPRPGTRLQCAPFEEPFRFTLHPAFGAYRSASDALPIAGTDRPWIYTSGLKGLQRAELDLEIFGGGYTCWPLAQPPVLDGRLDDPCWDGYRSVAVSNEPVAVTLRYDSQNLYVACQRSPAHDADGVRRPWKQALQRRDSPVWQDDAFEVHFSNLPKTAREFGTRALHLGVSASGARYDASWRFVTPFPALDVPPVDAAVDGRLDDWSGPALEIHSPPGARGKMRPARDFDLFLRLGWNPRGLLLAATVTDDVPREAANPADLAKGDSLDLFLTPRLASGEGYRLLLAPGVDPKHPQPRTRFADWRTTSAGAKLDAQVACQKTARGYVMEMLLPWANLQIQPAPGLEFGLQLMGHDLDGGKGAPFTVRWHPAGNPVSTKNPSAFHPLRLAQHPSPPVVFARRSAPDSDGGFTASEPLPFPIEVPPLGLQGEKADYAGEWSSAVRADSAAFAVEMAVPWRTLEAAGFERETLMVALDRRGPLTAPPALHQGFEPLIQVPAASTRPRTVSVRLHFAEIEPVGPGTRVFDVKVQGEVRLKDFDIIRAAGGARRAVVKEMHAIEAARSLSLELVPKAKAITAETAPVISGIEILAAPLPPRGPASPGTASARGGSSP
ncbi:MAG: PQQ-binding-like beta-propeller repeat protein [Verrucomicrobia bacterium]|nr:PQQ-binding-like beta-propeller repeat protein [Verrucomicrobiota bacterium]